MADKDNSVQGGCVHASEMREVTPGADGCQACLEMGDSWVHLRLCQICGHVGCCDNSKNKHATAHYHASGHPIIKSFEPGEDWGWCYEDEMYMKQVPVNAGKYYSQP